MLRIRDRSRRGHLSGDHAVAGRLLQGIDGVRCHTPPWMPDRFSGFRTLTSETFMPGGHPSGMHNLSKMQAMVNWALQLAAAGILLQTLFFKFPASQESVYIFTPLGAEPWGRIATGILEL